MGHEFTITYSEDFLEIPVPQDTGPCFIGVAQRQARLASNPARQAALKRARQKIGLWRKDLHAGDDLASLRLKAGMSQAQLGEAIGMTQSNISRLERNAGDLLASTVRKLALALNVSSEEILQAAEFSIQPSKEST